MTIKVLVADDQSIVRRGLEVFLTLDPEIEVVGTVKDGKEAYQEVQNLSPDLVLMDILMPGMDGIEATKLIKQQNPHTQVLVLTSVLDRASISRAIKAGADGYVLKDINAQALCQTIKSAGGGAIPVSPEAIRQLTKEISFPDTKAVLTKREKEVLQLIVAGRSNKQIAYILSLSEGTVKTHVGVILSKLGLQSRTQAALYAATHSLAH